MKNFSPLQLNILRLATTRHTPLPPFEPHYGVIRVGGLALKLAMRLERRGLLTLLSEERDYAVFIGNDAGRDALEATQ